MNRAHAYKASVDKNIAENQDPDYEIEMGLYSYPILMTADILMFKANSVPVGRDQIQHVEMARDIAQRFNHRFGKEIFVLPEAAIDENVQLLVGLDGRKMSKSYGNTIPLFQTPKQRQKSVNKIVTNLKEPGEPKQKDESPLFEIYQAFSTPEETREFEKMLNEGLAWGEAKKLLAAKIGAELDDKTDVYNDLIAHPSRIEDILQAGAAKARAEAKELLAEAKDAVGIRTLK
jgi:tryptophan--tRNA ligase